MEQSTTDWLADLTEKMRNLVAHMNVISEAPAAPMSRDGSASADKDWAPRGPNRTLGEIWWGYYQAAPLEEKNSVYEKARAVVYRAKSRKPQSGSGVDRDKFILEYYEGESAEFTAVCEGVSISSIWRVRRGAGRRQSDGRPV